MKIEPDPEESESRHVALSQIGIGELFSFASSDMPHGHDLEVWIRLILILPSSMASDSFVIAELKSGHARTVRDPYDLCVVRRRGKLVMEDP